MRRTLLAILVCAAACGPSHGGGDDDGGCTNLCTAFGWQKCVAPGVYEVPIACADGQTCVPEIGCTVCAPDQAYCGADNEVWHCNHDGTGGSLVEACPAGNVCSDGACKTPCERALDEPSTVGCDFWGVDLDNEAVSSPVLNDAAGQQFSIVIANNQDYEVQIQVLKNAGRVGAPLQEVVQTATTVAPHGIKQIDLPPREVDGASGQNAPYMMGTGSGTFVSPHGWHVITSGPVVAYQFNPIIQQYSNDASILIPIQALGKHHYMLGFPTSNFCGPPPGQFGSLQSIPDHTEIAIIGTQDDTHVTVVATHPIMASGGDSGFAIPATAKGQALTFTVNRYDVVNLESDQPVVPIQECLSYRDRDGDFTGSLITSNKPIAVFHGQERGNGNGGADIPDPPGWDGQTCCTDHLEEQMFPTTAWGREFVVNRSPVRSTDPSYQEPDIYRVVSAEDGVVITTNLAPPFDTFTLDAGKFKAFYADHGFTMKATGPVMIGQILVSQMRIPQGGIGDPSLLVFPAAEQFRKDYVFLVPSTFRDNYFVLSKPVDGTFTVDGHGLGELFDCTHAPIGVVENVDYEQVTCKVAEGGHVVAGSRPFGLTVYGYYSVGSYSYVGGADVKVINPIE